MSLKKISRYEIISELGRGGMATVYRARDPSFERDVAIKVLPREFLHDPTFRARFEREAKTIGTLEHPAIVPVYDFGEENGQPFLVMRYMSGGSLSDRIKQGPMLLTEVARIVSPLASAMDEAHMKGIIHRDIKPSNILFDQRGDPNLSDFGIVKVSEATAQLTGGGTVGTPAYMAPELAKAGGLSPLVDIYALGVTVYQMLTGELPYHADTPMGVLMAHMGQPIPDVREKRSDLPPDVQTVMLQVLAKEPSDRYQAAGDFSNDLLAATALATTDGIVDAPAGMLLGKSPPPEPARPPTPPDKVTMDGMEEEAPPGGDILGTIPVAPTPAPQIPERPRLAPAMPDSDVAVPVLDEKPKERNIPLWAWIGGGIVGLVLCAGACIGLLMITGTLNRDGIGDPATDEGTPSLTLNNRSSSTICTVYISPNTDPNWNTQGNRLGADTIPPADSYTFTELPAGEYDLRADDCDGNTLDTQWGWPITGSEHWTITDASADQGQIETGEEGVAGGIVYITSDLSDPAVCGDSFTGTVAEGYEHHIPFNGTAGQMVAIAMNRVSEIDPYLHLIAPSGNEEVTNDDGGGYPNSLIENHVLQETGIYMIVARGFGLGGGEYELIITCDEPSSSGGGSSTGDTYNCEELLEMGSIDCGDTVTMTIPDGIEHHYTFDGVAGQVVTIGMDRVEDVDPYLRLIAPSGEEEIRNDDGGEGLNSLIENHALEETGTYTIVAHDFGTCNAGEYQLSVVCGGTSGSDAAAGTVGIGDAYWCEEAVDVGTLSCGNTETGALWVDHEHHYTFHGSAGDAITIAMNRIRDVDPRLRLYSPSGNLEEENDDGGEGLNSLIDNHVLEESGVYTIVAYDFSQCTDAGEYEIILTCGGTSSSDGGETTGGSITCGETVSGYVAEDDESEWTFRGSAGDVVTIAMYRADGSMDTVLELNDPDGNQEEYDDDGGEGFNSLIEDYALEDSGDYTIIARGIAHAEGNYTLSLECR